MRKIKALSQKKIYIYIYKKNLIFLYRPTAPFRVLEGKKPYKLIIF